MGAKGFFLVLVLLAVVGAGAGYGAAQLVPQDEEEQATETADLVAPGTDAADAGAAVTTGRARQSGGQPTADDFIAALPEEQRRELESNPEAAAMARAQIQMAIDSGMIPPEVLQEMGLGGTVDAAPGAAPEEGARNAEPLTGTVASFGDGMLRLETPDGEAAIAVPEDAPVNVTKTAAEASDYLAEGAEVSVVARPDESGGLAAAAVIVGGAGQGATSGRGFGGLAAVVMGSITSFADGVLTLETADGAAEAAVAEFAVADDTPVRITATAAEAASELAAGVTVTAFVQREADGSLSAASVNVGGGGGGFGRGLFGGGQGGRQRGGAGGGQGGGESGG
ncbi:MAG: hypothetical protein F4Y25_11805 [Chloroflexi bacterium]|nr:hypothetical protein [Chloroflexota bacterium]